MDYKRLDGRLPNELRDVTITFDRLDGVDGSAQFGFGETKALASISGPMEVRLAVEQASKATFEVVVRPLAGLPGTDAKALASALRSALTPSLILTNNPRSLVQLVALAISPLPPLSSSLGRTPATILRTSPALITALINASSLALLNAASVPLRGVVCAASVGRVRSTGGLVVDPQEAELASLDGAGAFAFLVTSSKSPSSSEQQSILQDQSNPQVEQNPKAELVWSHWNAVPFDEDELARATELAGAGALRVREEMKGAVERVMSGSFKAKKDGKETTALKTVDVEPLDDVKMEIS